MKRIFVTLIAGMLLLNACSAATGIEVTHAWARPAVKDSNGAIYFLLQNHSASADKLLRISSDVADVVEMHESRMEGDVMQMRQVTSLPIRGKASIEFAPGGYHAMLVTLKEDVKIGDEIEITLHFKKHDDITISVPVQEGADTNSMPEH